MIRGKTNKFSISLHKDKYNSPVPNTQQYYNSCSQLKKSKKIGYSHLCNKKKNIFVKF